MDKIYQRTSLFFLRSSSNQYQISGVRHQKYKIQYLDTKGLRIILPCALYLFFLLFAGIGIVWAAPPIAVNDPNYTVNEDHPLLVTDPNEGVLSNDIGLNTNLKIKVTDNVDNGTLKILDFYNGSFSYDPNNNFNGKDNFTYQLYDPNNPTDDIEQPSWDSTKPIKEPFELQCHCTSHYRSHHPGYGSKLPNITIKSAKRALGTRCFKA